VVDPGVPGELAGSAFERLLLLHWIKAAEKDMNNKIDILTTEFSM
jgi:hypothetical protein